MDGRILQNDESFQALPLVWENPRQTHTLPRYILGGMGASNGWNVASWIQAFNKKNTGTVGFRAFLQDPRESPHTEQPNKPLLLPPKTTKFFSPLLVGYTNKKNGF